MKNQDPETFLLEEFKKIVHKKVLKTVKFSDSKLSVKQFIKELCNFEETVNIVNTAPYTLPEVLGIIVNVNKNNRKIHRAVKEICNDIIDDDYEIELNYIKISNAKPKPKNKLIFNLHQSDIIHKRLKELRIDRKGNRIAIALFEYLFNYKPTVVVNRYNLILAQLNEDGRPIIDTGRCILIQSGDNSYKADYSNLREQLHNLDFDVILKKGIQIQGVQYKVLTSKFVPEHHRVVIDLGELKQLPLGRMSISIPNYIYENISDPLA